MRNSMAPIRSIRWSGGGISNSRQILLRVPPTVRQYSVRTPLGKTRTTNTTRSWPTLYSHNLQQHRSLSLFGWGNSSKSPSADPPLSESTQSAWDGVRSKTADAIETSKTVKASYDTSDSLSPSQVQSHLQSPLEPEHLENWQKLNTESLSDGGAGAVDYASVPERIGYLKEVCGLDFGWGPTAVMEWILEHLHITWGLSWSAAIIFLAVTLRSAMLPAIVSSARQQKKMRAAAPILTPLREQYKEALVLGEKAKAQELQMQMRLISKEYDISIAKAFVPMLVQIPFSYGAWRTLRHCGTLPVPGFVTESWLWTSDLSFSDPYLITPMLSSLMIYLTFKTNMSTNASTMNIDFMRLMSTAFPVISFVFMLFQPGSVQLYFLASSFIGLLTARLMQIQAWRNFCKLGPLPNSPAGRASIAATPRYTPPGSSTSSSSSSSSSTASSTSTSSSQPPGGLRLRQASKPTPTTEPSPSSPTENRSVIDRGVDAVKNQWSTVKTSAENIREQTMGKASSREETARRERLDKYEAEERARLDEERERRNELKRKGRGG